MILAHLADIHLGFRRYHRQTAHGVNQREADVAHAFRRAVDGVIEARPEAVLIAGDLFHQVRPTNAAIVFAFQQIQRLRRELPDAPVVVIAGNHDTPRSSETGSILRLYQELGVDVALDQARRFAYPALDLSILAVPYPALRDAERPVLRPAGPERHQVLLLHGELEGVYPPAISGAAWGGVVVRRDEVHAAEWSYVALGHYHVQYAAEPRVWYAGALDYVSPNPWGELQDERERSGQQKGWLRVDLAAGRVTRQPIPLARRVIDLPALYAGGLSAADLNRLLRERLDGIEGGWRDQVVRQVVFDVARPLARELDQAAIRAVKAEALHYQLDLRRPAAAVGLGVDPSGRRLPLSELLRDYLTRRPLPAEVGREAFVAAGLALLARVEREEDGEAGAGPGDG